MSKRDLSKIAAKMRGMDICMLTTVTSGGQLGGRPMSNNGEVEYDGTSYFFTWQDSRMAQDIASNKNVQLGFKADQGFLFVSVQGEATLVTDKAAMREHWTDDLNQWFKEGLDTPGVVMIQVEARRINWWGEEDGEIELES